MPPRLEALVQSLSDKIEQIQQSRGDNVAVGHLEDRIVKLVERLDASDSRLGHLEAIERGLADLLVHIEDMRANKDTGGLRADNSPGVDALKHDIARTQDALDAVNGTLGHVVDRLVVDRKGHPRRDAPAPGDRRRIRRNSPAGRQGRRPRGRAMRRRRRAARRARRRRLPAAPAHRQPAAAAGRTAAPRPNACRRRAGCRSIPICRPISRSSPAPDRRALRAHAGARIAASRSRPRRRRRRARAGGKSSFIAAARRAAQAAVQAPPSRAPRPEPIEVGRRPSAPSLRGKMMKRVKSLFIAASIVAVVIGSVQIAGNFFDFGGPDTSRHQDRQSPRCGSRANRPPPTSSRRRRPPSPSIRSSRRSMPALAPLAPLAMPSANSVIAITPPLDSTPAPHRHARRC